MPEEILTEFDLEAKREEYRSIPLDVLEDRLNELHQTKAQMIQKVKDWDDDFNPEGRRKLHRTIVFIKAVIRTALVIYQERFEAGKEEYARVLRQEYEQYSFQQIEEKRKELKSQITNIFNQIELSKAEFDISRVPQPDVPRLKRVQEKLKFQYKTLTDVLQSRQAEKAKLNAEKNIDKRILEATQKSEDAAKRYQRQLSVEHYKRQFLLELVRGMSREIQPTVFNDCLNAVIENWLTVMEGRQNLNVDIEQDIIPFLNHIRVVLKDQISENDQ